MLFRSRYFAHASKLLFHLTLQALKYGTMGKSLTRSLRSTTRY